MRVYKVILPIFFALLVGWTVKASGATVATVLGKPISIAELNPKGDILESIKKQDPTTQQFAIREYRLGQFVEKVTNALIEDIADEQGITVNGEYQAAFVAQFGESLADNGTDKIKAIARREVLRWQVEKALFTQYGGTVVYRQGNPLFPVEAYRKLIAQYQAAGKITIEIDDYATRLKETFAPPYQFVLPSESIDFSKPWWLVPGE